MIMRLPGAYPTRCRAVVHNGIVSMFAISTKKSSSLYEQTKSALAQVDTNLAEMGTVKGRILTALVFITDMAQKDDMNRAWDEWADRANPPMRLRRRRTHRRFIGRNRPHGSDMIPVSSRSATASTAAMRVRCGPSQAERAGQQSQSFPHEFGGAPFWPHLR
jgi:hypothetical protein